MCRQSVFLVTKIFWLVFALLTFLGTSCSVYKPDSEYVYSENDYNQRLNVEDPHYDKAISVLGVSSMAAGTAAGAYAGYTFGEEADMFPYYEGDKLRHRNWASAIVGGAIGFAGTYLANRAFGWGKRKEAESFREWVQDANPNYKILSDITEYDVIHKDAEQSYTVRNFGDARDFMTVFGAQSPYFENMAGQVADNNAISRGEYGEAVSLLSESRYVSEFKNKYYKLSNTIPMLIEASNKFPILLEKSEKKAAAKVKSLEDAKTFKKGFGQNGWQAYKAEIARQVYPYMKNQEMLTAFINMFPESGLIKQAKSKYISFAGDLEEYLTATNKYEVDRKERSQKALSFVENREDAVIFKDEFEPNCQLCDDALKKVIDQIRWHQYPEIKKEFGSNLSRSFIDDIDFKYQKGKVLAFRSCETASDFQSFIDISKNLPRIGLGLLEKAQYGYDKLSANSISALKTFADNYNEYDWADKKAYRKTSNRDIGSCRSYLNYFSNGDYVERVRDKLQEAKAYKREQERIAREKRKREQFGYPPSSVDGSPDTDKFKINTGGYWSDEMEYSHSFDNYKYEVKVNNQGGMEADFCYDEYCYCDVSVDVDGYSDKGKYVLSYKGQYSGMTQKEGDINEDMNVSVVHGSPIIVAVSIYSEENDESVQFQLLLPRAGSWYIDIYD